MKPQQLRNRILAADLAWIPVALAAEQALCSGLHCSHIPLGPSNFVVYVGCTVFVWVLLSENLPLDGFRSGWRLPALVSHLLLAVAVLMALLLAVENVSERYVGQADTKCLLPVSADWLPLHSRVRPAPGITSIPEWTGPPRCYLGF